MTSDEGPQDDAGPLHAEPGRAPSAGPAVAAPAAGPVTSAAAPSPSGQRALTPAPAFDLLTLLMPSSVFLDNDIDSLLGASGAGSHEAWLGILLVPEPAWAAPDLLSAADNVRRRAHVAAVVVPANVEATKGLPLPVGLPVIAPQALPNALEALARLCPAAGGTVVLAWPGSTEAGLLLLRQARQRCLAARAAQPATPSVEAAAAPADTAAAEPPAR